MTKYQRLMHERARWGYPTYWMHAGSTSLREAVRAYLNREEMTAEQIAELREYFRQWVMTPTFVGPDIDELRARVDALTDRAAISLWLHDAEEACIDPL